MMKENLQNFWKIQNFASFVFGGLQSVDNNICFEESTKKHKIRIKSTKRKIKQKKRLK
ncbi:MAG: hypothetical protein J6B90_09095 [Lachnospiraceae bacterium]|nr:hypothetical protein [Lachnospiraceae bacterium]